MTDFSGTVHPDEDPLRYRGDERPVDREISRLRSELSNQLADVSHRLRSVQKTVATLMLLLWVVLGLSLILAGVCGYLVLSG